MKHIKLFEGFLNEHKSTEDMSFAEIKKTKEDLTKSGGFKMYVGKDHQVTKLLRSLTSLSSPWVERESDTQIKVYDTPDEDSKHEIEDMIAEFGLSTVDLNSLKENKEEAPSKPFFIEATEKTIDDKLVAAGIKGGRKLPPPYVGVSANGIVWEMFRHEEGGKKGWKIHPTGRTIKPEAIEKYMNEGREIMVADMDVEAAGLVSEIKDSLDFASAKLYDLKKMSDYIKNDYPELSKNIAEVVEPMMTELENEYPKKLQELLKKFK
jgi:hypothetical protein